MHEMCGALNEHSRQTITDSINAHTAIGMLEHTVAGFAVFREELVDLNNSLPVTVRRSEDTLMGDYVGAVTRANLLDKYEADMLKYKVDRGVSDLMP